MEKLLQEYINKFDENFPLYLVMGMKEDAITKILEKSIETGVPYEPEMIEGVIY